MFCIDSPLRLIHVTITPITICHIVVMKARAKEKLTLVTDTTQNANDGLLSSLMGDA